MHTLKVSNFRCFYQEQTARLAPLTILVGENNTGKSSLLALIHLIWSIGNRTDPVSYNDAKFPLGRFEDMVSDLSKAHDATPQTEVGIDYIAKLDPKNTEEYSFQVQLRGHKFAPRVSSVAISNNTKNVCLYLDVIDDKTIYAFAKVQSSSTKEIEKIEFRVNSDIDLLSENLFSLLTDLFRKLERDELAAESISDNSTLSESTEKLTNFELESLKSLIKSHIGKFDQPIQLNAMAPIRSKPKRIYERIGMEIDHEGTHTPEALANLKTFHTNWNEVKQKLNNFGKKSGLFRDFEIEFIYGNESNPYEILINTSEQNGKMASKKYHNIVDVGYGVSQALAIMVELYTNTNEQIVLMQQPEVHLHPRAQAELGSVLCELAGPERMLFVETHSDYLLDRIRINVRKGIGNIKAKDVSILFFKRYGESAKIFSMRLDEQGNIIDAPDEYMEFFVKEGNELLGLA